MKHFSPSLQKAMTLLVVAVFITALLLLASPAERVGAGVEHNVSGFAWSDNIGWVSFNCTDTASCGAVNYGVTATEGSGELSGYGWSDNIGWVSFNGDDLRSCPTAPCEARFDGTRLTGWARALSHGDGWDGWIRLSDTIGDISYGVSSDGVSFDGFAWGANVVGWVLFDLSFGGFEEAEVAPQCSDRRDNDDDGLIDADDPGCWANPNVSISYNPLDDDEFNARLPLISASPNVFLRGESTTISWECFDSTESIGINFNTGGAVSGIAVSAPLDDTIYTVACSNGGEASAGVDVLHPDLSISADPSLIRPQGSSTISWSAVNVLGCIVEGPTGETFAEGAEGSKSTGPLEERSEYTIVCDAADGTTQKESTVVNITPEFGEI